MLEGPQHLLLTTEGTKPITMSEGLTDSSLPLGRNLDLENTKLLPEVIKLNFGHFQHRITSRLITFKDNLRDFMRTNYIRGQPTGSITSQKPMSFTRIYAQTTCLTDYARTPSFESSRSGSHTRASLLLSASYKNASQINQIKQYFSKETYYLPNI